MNAIDQDIRVPRIPIIDIDKSLTCYGTPLGFDINFDDTEVGGIAGIPQGNRRMSLTRSAP